MRRVLETISANPKPRDGRTLMKRFAEIHFDNCPAGGQGRKRNLGDVEAFLEFAVKKAGTLQRWLPPDKEFKRSFTRRKRGVKIPNAFIYNRFRLITSTCSKITLDLFASGQFLLEVEA